MAGGQAVALDKWATACLPGKTDVIVKTYSNKSKHEISMKKILLSLLVALVAATSALAQGAFEWGTAQWNISDGKAFSSIDDLNREGVTLVYPNDGQFNFTFLNIVKVDYDVYVDDSTVGESYSSSAQGGCAVTLDYWFVEGHKYTIKTKGALLAQANLATRQTDTLSVNNDSYTVSFSVAGPELVKTIDVEGTMALAVTNQEYTKTVSLIDSKSIAEALGIGSISEAAIYGLNVNGSYNPYWSSSFDGWRDADGELTNYMGGYNSVFGHNAYPAVYCVKLNEAADSVTYYFFDSWREYNPDESGETGGGVLTRSMTEAPKTSYHRVVWDWTNEDGTVTQYTRSYRCDEGADYKAGFMIVANGKAVKINATLHFVSDADYAKYLENQGNTYEGAVVTGVAPAAAPASPIMTTNEAQTVKVTPCSQSSEYVNVTWSGFNIMPMNLPTGEMTFQYVSVTTDADGRKVFESEPTTVKVMRGQMAVSYQAQLTGVQEAGAQTPVFVLKLSQATVVTAVFAADEAAAKAELDKYYATQTAVDGVEAGEAEEAVYSVGGVRQPAVFGGVSIVKKGGKVIKVMK